MRNKEANNTQGCDYAYNKMLYKSTFHNSVAVTIIIICYH